MPKKGLYGKVNRAWEAKGEAELEGQRKEEARRGRNEVPVSLYTGPLFSSINQMASTFTVPCHFHSLKTSASLWHHLAAFSLASLCHMTGPDALSSFCPHYQLPQVSVSTLNSGEWNSIGSGHSFPPGQRSKSSLWMDYYIF